MVLLRPPGGRQRGAAALCNVELQVLPGHAPRQRHPDPPVQLRPGGPFLGHDRGHDGDHVGAADLVEAPFQDGAAVPLQGTTPILGTEALPVRSRLPHGRRRVTTLARHLTIGERRSTRLGEPDVRIPAEPEVAALAVDRQPLHPVAAPAAGLHDQEERPAVAVRSWPKGRDLQQNRNVSVFRRRRNTIGVLEGRRRTGCSRRSVAPRASAPTAGRPCWPRRTARRRRRR